MNIVDKKLTEITPYENNPRNNEKAVEYVKNSIKEFGFKVPIVIDKNGIIVAGHTRYLASQELGLKTVPCIVADDLTEEQVKAFRLADNKVSEIASWDFALLDLELDDIQLDMEQFGFMDLDLEDIDLDELDKTEEKTNVSVTLNFENVNDYESVKERLENIIDEVNGTMAVKMV